MNEEISSSISSPLPVLQEDPETPEQWTSLEQRKSALLQSSNEESLKENQPLNHIPTITSVENTKQKLNKQSNSIDLSHAKKNSKINNEDDDRYVSSNTLEINEKSWILSTAQADLVKMRILLDQDLTLADKKDFVMNGIHWAAKKGNENMLNMLLDLKVDVNLKSGYTPLHLAAIHGHERCLSLLLDHGANVHTRDYSGKKAIDYLQPGEEDDLPCDEDSPKWKQHYYSGPNPQSIISDDLYNRIKIKIVTSKLDDAVIFRNRFENGAANNDHKQRSKSVAFIETRSVFGDEPTKPSKISRKESSRSSWRIPSIRKQKPLSVSDHLLIEHPAITPIHEPSPISSSSWKPAGPKT